MHGYWQRHRSIKLQPDKLRFRLYEGTVCVSVYLWDIPIITLSTPLLLDTSMIVLRAGMSDSHPSRPNLFSEDHFFWRNSSNLWARGGAAASHYVSPTSLPPPQTQKNTQFSTCLEWLSRCVCVEEGVLRWSDTQTSWIWSSGLKESSSPPDWTSWFQVSQTSVGSTGTAARH